MRAGIRSVWPHLVAPILVGLAICESTLMAQGSIAERVAAVDARLLAERARLAGVAFDAGLLREASVLARHVITAKPDHAVLELVTKMKAMSGDDFVKTYKDAVKASGREVRKQIEATLAPIAEELATLADEAMAAGNAELGEDLHGRAFALDPENKRAYQALKKLDYDAIFNYGVLPKADKRSAREVLKRLDGRFLGRSDLAKELEDWVDAWGLQTKHYRFVTNAPHGTVFAFAQACEDLHDAWEDWMRENKQSLRKLTRPCTVFLFGTQVDYECVLRLMGEDPPDSEAALGYYSPQTKVGHFYYDEEFYAGDMTLLFETFYHEGAHQMFDLRLKAAWRGRADEQPLHWVEEGTSVYLESLVMEGEGRKRKGRFGTLIDDDLGTALELAATDNLMPSADFAHMSGEEWNAYGGGYPHAALVVHWLLEADGGKRRKAAMELLLAERQHGGLRKGTFFELVGMEPADVDAALKAYAADIKQRLTIRTYGEPAADKGK
ncbi:MAG: hypothetical protein KDC98_24340 [Planctomycetes bacterium]|nr:hypothetical protein [Planctomycetota bacterium]